MKSVSSFSLKSKKSSVSTSNPFCNKRIFADYLHDLVREKNLLEPDVYKRAGISKQTWSNLYSAKTCPTPENSRRLVIGLKCSLPEAEKLLALCGYTFIEGCEYDDCIKACLAEGIFNYTYVELNIYQNSISA